jgi:hypothetical protein
MSEMDLCARHSPSLTAKRLCQRLLTSFNAGLQGITLTNSSGKSVTLLSQSVGTEFVHLNGLAEPVIMNDGVGLA